MSLLTGPMRKHLDGHKELTSHTELVKVEAGSLVYIPLINGNSTAVEVLVKEGDSVKVGTMIAKRNDHFTVPYFSSVSGTVKGIQRMNFDVFDFHHVAWLHHDAALFWHAPANPQIHAGLRPDKRYVVRTVLHDRCRHVHVDMIVVIVGRENGVDLANGKRIKHKRRGAQVRLKFFHASHTLHLVAFFHQRITVALFAGAAPEINANVGAAF